MPLPGRESAPLHENAQDLAYQQLREWIWNGPLKPGELVRDVEVAALLGVSRTPVREAIIRLTQEGLIETGSGRKARVSSPDFSRAPDLYRIGGVLDGLAAEWAAPLVGADEIAAMRNVLSRMDHERDPARLVKLDLEFHEIYRRHVSPVLQEHLDQIETELTRLERVAFDSEGIKSLAYGDHVGIVAAFEAGDPAAVREAVVENWVSSWNRLAPHLKTATDVSVSKPSTKAS